MRWKTVLGSVVLATVAACGWPATKMEPLSEYPTNGKAMVTAAPAFTAGPDYVVTRSPDSSAAIVCQNGSVREAGPVAAPRTESC